MKNKQNFAGFTLIELLVVIVIIGILSTIAVSSFNGYFEKARLAVAVSFASQVEKKLMFKSIEIEKSQVLNVSFSEGSGSIVRDLFNGIYFTGLDPSKWVEDTPSGNGYSMRFGQSGAGDHGFTTADFDDALIIDNNQLTMSAWVKRNVNGKRSFLLGAVNGYGLIILPNGSPSFHLKWQNGNGALTLRGVDPLIVGEWNHILGTFDGNNMKLYINGSLVDERAIYYSLPHFPVVVIGDDLTYSDGADFLLDGPMIYPFFFDPQSEF